MNTYTFYLHDGPDAIPAFEIEMFESRAAALVFARELLADRRRYDRVVVTEEAIEIARFDRSSPGPVERKTHLCAEG
jgi:hypothetical protein